MEMAERNAALRPASAWKYEKSRPQLMVELENIGRYAEMLETRLAAIRKLTDVPWWRRLSVIRNIRTMATLHE